MSSRSKMRRSALAFAVLMSVALVGGLTTATTASAAPAFRAVGSAKQVYVTGLAPSASMSLVNSAGKTIETQSSSSLGGLLFRNVPPATGYRVRRNSDGVQSAAITVHSEAAAPYPTLIEYSGYGYANPAGPTNGIAVLANLMGFAVVDVNMRGTGCSGGA